MIRLTNINKFYDSKFQRTYVLKDIMLDVNEGEFLSIMGPSGFRKLTLMNIIGLMDAPSSGTYLPDGNSALDLKEKARVDNHLSLI